MPATCLLPQQNHAAVFEEMAGAAMAAIEIQGASGEEFSHDRGDADLTALEKEVDVIVHKDPGIVPSASYSETQVKASFLLLYRPYFYE